MVSTVVFLLVRRPLAVVGLGNRPDEKDVEIASYATNWPRYAARSPTRGTPRPIGYCWPRSPNSSPARAGRRSSSLPPRWCAGTASSSADAGPTRSSAMVAGWRTRRCNWCSRRTDRLGGLLHECQRATWSNSWPAESHTCTLRDPPGPRRHGAESASAGALAVHGRHDGRGRRRPPGQRRTPRARPTGRPHTPQPAQPARPRPDPQTRLRQSMWLRILSHPVELAQGGPV